MSKIIIFTLVYLSLNIINGFSLQGTQEKPADTYEVKESQDLIKIINPKAEKPTLREIIFYHVIEKPYSDHKSNYYDRPHLDVTRPFTNGHGFQYLDHTETDNPPTNDDVSPNEEIVEKNEGENVNEEEQEKIADDLDQVPNNEELEPVYDIENVTEIIKDDETLKYDDEILKDGDEILKHGDETLKDGDGQENQTESVLNRRKREVNNFNLPDPPQMPEFNMNILPDYIKAILPKDEQKTLPKDNKTINDFDETLKAELKKLDELLDEISGNEVNESKTEGPEGPTYGMSLAGNDGEVWNDLPKTKYSYKIGNGTQHHTEASKDQIPATTEPTINKPTTNANDIDEDDASDILSSLNDIGHIIDKLINKIDENSTENDLDTDKHKNNTFTNNITTDKPKDSKVKNDSINDLINKINDIFKNKLDDTLPNNVTTDKPKDSNVKNDSTDDLINKINEIFKKQLGNELNDSKTGSNDTKTGSDDTKTSSNDPETGSNNDKDITPTTEINDYDNVTEVTSAGNSKGNADSKNPDVVKDLMNNEKFWKWLKDSSEAYIDLILKRLDVVIKVEIEKQIKLYLKGHKDQICDKTNGVTEKTTEDPGKKEQSTENSTNTNEIDTTTKNTAIVNDDGDQTTPKIDFTSENPVENNNKDETTPKEDDNLKNTTNIENNLNDKSKNVTNKPKENKESKHRAKPDANNIFSYIAGGEKVTNVFIFNVNGKDLNDFNLVGNNSKGVLVFNADDKGKDVKLEVKPKNETKNDINETKTEKSDVKTTTPKADIENTTKLHNDSDKIENDTEILEANANLDSNADENKDHNPETKTHAVDEPNDVTVNAVDEPTVTVTDKDDEDKDTDDLKDSGDKDEPVITEDVNKNGDEKSESQEITKLEDQAEKNETVTEEIKSENEVVTTENIVAETTTEKENDKEKSTEIPQTEGPEKVEDNS